MACRIEKRWRLGRTKGRTASFSIWQAWWDRDKRLCGVYHPQNLFYAIMSPQAFSWRTRRPFHYGIKAKILHSNKEKSIFYIYIYITTERENKKVCVKREREGALECKSGDDAVEDSSRSMKFRFRERSALHHRDISSSPSYIYIYIWKLCHFSLYFLSARDAPPDEEGHKWRKLTAREREKKRQSSTNRFKKRHSVLFFMDDIGRRTMFEASANQISLCERVKSSKSLNDCTLRIPYSRRIDRLFVLYVIKAPTVKAGQLDYKWAIRF